jgi:hypothetical protein
LLVDVRISIQRDFLHCFHVQMCYHPSEFISNWPLHWFLKSFSCLPLSL